MVSSPILQYIGLAVLLAGGLLFSVDQHTTGPTVRDAGVQEQRSRRSVSNERGVRVERDRALTDAVQPAGALAVRSAGLSVLSDVCCIAALAPQADVDTSDGAQAAALREVGETARNFGLRALGAVLVLVLTFFLVKGMAFVLETLSERSAERRLLYKRLVPIFRVLMWTIALFLVLRGIFDVDAQGLFAAAAAIGVAIGFAAQDLLKNIFGGLVIIFDQSFQVGDKIRVDDTYGEVTSIGLRSTRIVTPDDNLVTVPNAQVADHQVSNANAGNLDCQVATDLYLPGWVDEGRAKKIAYQAAVSSTYVYLEKPVVVLVNDEYDEGHLVHLRVKAYVIDTRYENLLQSDITERARRVFREEGFLPPMTRSYVDLPASAGPPFSSDVTTSG